MTTQTARNYIAVIEAFGAQKQLYCKSLLQYFTAEALYYLSRDTTPEEAIRDALKLAKKGERVTLAVAKELAAKYTVDESDGEEEHDTGSDLSMGGRCNSSPYARAREGSHARRHHAYRAACRLTRAHARGAIHSNKV